jgi:hypothetical protein
MRSLMICTPHQILLGDQIENEMGGTCSRRVAKRGVYRVLVENPGGKRYLGDPDVDGRVMLRWIFRKWDVGVWTGSNWLRIGKFGGTCKCGNKPSGTIKRGEFLD